MRYFGCLQFEYLPIYVPVFFGVLCLTVLVNYLLNAFAICVGESYCVFLLANPCIVFQRVCVLCL